MSCKIKKKSAEIAQKTGDGAGCQWLGRWERGGPPVLLSGDLGGDGDKRVHAEEDGVAAEEVDEGGADVERHHVGQRLADQVVHVVEPLVEVVVLVLLLRARDVPLEERHPPAGEVSASRREKRGRGVSVDAEKGEGVVVKASVGTWAWTYVCTDDNEEPTYIPPLMFHSPPKKKKKTSPQQTHTHTRARARART